MPPSYQIVLEHDELVLLVAVLRGVVTSEGFKDADWLPDITELTSDLEAMIVAEE